MIYDYLCNHFVSFEIIIVDDCSSDNSVKKLRETTGKMNTQVIHLITMSFSQGTEAAMKAGVDFAKGDFILEFDNLYVDYDVTIIHSIYNKCLEGVDIVNASVVQKGTLQKRIFFYLLNKSSKFQHKVGYESFRILSRRAVNRVHSMSKTVPYRKAIYANCGLAMSTILYESIDSKVTTLANQLRNTYSHNIDIFIIFTSLAFRATLTMALIMMTFSLTLGIYVIVQYFSAQKPVEGWSSIMLFISISLFFMFCILAIILRYLAVIINLVFNKKSYQFDSISKIN